MVSGIGGTYSKHPFRTDAERVAETANSVDVGQPYNTLPSLFRGNRSCRRHRAISMPFGRGKSKLYLGGYCVLSIISSCCADLPKTRTVMQNNGLPCPESWIP